MDQRQAGFTLVEVVLGAAIATFVLFVALGFTHNLIGTAARVNAHVQGDIAVERLAERLSAEAASAWAVYVPATDVLDNANADGHEIAFFSEDGAHRSYAWAYLYDASSETVTRYSYGPAVTPTPGEKIGPITSFQATATDIENLGDPLFAAATAPAVHYTYATMNGAVGGNAIVSLHLAATGAHRIEELASATAPTSFTVIINYTPPPPPAPSATPLPLPMPTLSPSPPP
jgi:hypothetical protein